MCFTKSHRKTSITQATHRKLSLIKSYWKDQIVLCTLKFCTGAASLMLRQSLGAATAKARSHFWLRYVLGILSNFRVADLKVRPVWYLIKSWSAVVLNITSAQLWFGIKHEAAVVKCKIYTHILQWHLIKETIL